MTLLRQVLQAFEQANHPLTLGQMARDLDVPPDVLDGMIHYWVRKGRLREVDTGMACGSCGHANGCPFVMQPPRQYTLATGDDPQYRLQPPGCGCCS